MIDFIIVFTLLAFFIKGYLIGDTKEMIGIFSMILTCFIALFPANGILSDMKSVGFPEEIGFLTGFVISSLLTFPFVYLFMNYFFKDFQYEGERISTSKRVLGAFIGVFKGGAISVLFLHLLTELPLKSGLVDRSFFIAHILN